MWFANSAHLFSSAFPVLENLLTPSNSLFAKSSFDNGVLPVPMMPNRSGIQSSRNKLYKAGASFLQQRSPVAPYITKMVGCDFICFITFPALLFYSISVHIFLHPKMKTSKILPRAL